MNFEACFNGSSAILMEGAVGERLKREYKISTEGVVALAGLIYDHQSRNAMQNVYKEMLLWQKGITCLLW